MFVVTSMGGSSSRHSVYFDVTWEVDTSISYGPPVYYTGEATMNTQESAVLRAEAQAVADRLNAVVGPDFDPHRISGYRETMKPLAVYPRLSPGQERSQQVDKLVETLSALRASQSI